MKAGEHLLPAIGPLGAQLPATGVEGIALQPGDAGLQCQLSEQRLRPLPGQRIHARRRYPMRLARRQSGGSNPPLRVQHPHGVGAPGLAQARHGGQRLGKARITLGEILGAMVKAAKEAAARGHAATHAPAFFKQLHGVPGLHQRAGAGNAGHASANHSQMLGGRQGHGGYLRELCCWMNFTRLGGVPAKRRAWPVAPAGSATTARPDPGPRGRCGARRNAPAPRAAAAPSA